MTSASVQHLYCEGRWSGSRAKQRIPKCNYQGVDEGVTASASSSISSHTREQLKISVLGFLSLLGWNVLSVGCDLGIMLVSERCLSLGLCDDFFLSWLKVRHCFLQSCAAQRPSITLQSFFCRTDTPSHGHITAHRQ